MRLFALLPILLSASTAFAAWPSKGLAGHWRFDNANMQSAADLSPGARKLNLESAAFESELGKARSLRCDGVETSGTIDETTPLDFAAGFSMAVWVRPERVRRYDPVTGRPNPSNPSWTTPAVGLYIDMGRPVFGLFKTGRILLEGPPIATNRWSLIVITGDNKQLAMWIDGKRVAETKQTFAVPAAGGLPWYVGRSNLRYFRGRIGELALWTRALGSEEVAAIGQATAARYPKTEPKATVQRDRTVMVASPGSNEKNGTWVERPTRMLEGLAGFTPTSAPPLDRWGGRTDLPARKATGFFRSEKIGGRWWLITPEGHLFWNMGVNTVNRPRNVPAADSDTWAVKATRELRELGFNGVSTGRQSPVHRIDNALPWCQRVDFIASFAKEHKRTYATSGHTGFEQQCAPVFHPEFAKWAVEYAARLGADAADPAILGIFTDNEIECPLDVLDRHLKLDANDEYLRHGRTAAEAWLKARNRPVDAAQLKYRDRLEFAAYYLGTYSRIVHDAIRKYDRNHLIFGSRFHVHASQFENPYFWPAVGPWMDVVAVNYYALWGPQTGDIDAWSASMNKPLMLTEWYSKAQDAAGLANTNGAGWLVRTQEDRALYYQHFVMAALETKSLVGVHYFKYLDDPKESVALDAAGGANKGLFTADGVPWDALQKRARAVNTQLYRLIDFFDVRK